MRSSLPFLYRSVRLRLGVIFLGLSFLVGLSAFTGFQIVSVRQTSDPLHAAADAQSAAAYRLATLARKLAFTTNDADAKAITSLIDNGIASFDENEKLLREGDSAQGIPPLTNVQALEALSRSNTQWTRYRELLTAYKENPKQLELLPQIDTQATAVFVYTTEVRDSIDLLVDTAFQNAERTFAIVAGITVTILVLSYLLLVQVGRSLTRLSVTANAYTNGQYDAKVGKQSLTEFAAVASAFTEMATAVASRENELKDVNLILEKRVEQRTEELRKARDEAVAASRLAQESARLKSEFLATMSHELRTPLNAIEGFTSIMLSNMGVDLPVRAKSMVERISANSKRLLGLINDFLDLSRIESGRLDLVKSPISVDNMIKRWASQVNVLADQKKLAFNVELAPSMPSTIMGDEEALSKIAINLLGNAFKFTQEGSVNLLVGPSDESYFNIVVRDTGIGIPPHAREYIFEEFRQVDGSSKRKYGGTGLGLSIVQKLARAMGGNVTLQSELGNGSTFTVNLPLEVEVGLTQGALS